MRLRALIAAATAAVVVGTGVPATAQVDTMHFVYQLADASWLVREKKGVYMYLAAAVHIDDPTRSRVTRAVVTRTKCSVSRAGNMTAIACAWGGRMRKIPQASFDFDPTLESARLRIPRARVRWTGEDVAFPDADAGADPAFGAWAIASVDRFATAAGRLFGRRMRSGGFFDFGWLEEGAVVAAFTSGSGLRITRDGRATLDVEIRVPSRAGPQSP